MSKYKISYDGWSDEASPIKSDVKIKVSHAKLVHYGRLAIRERTNSEREKLSKAGRNKVMSEEAKGKISKGNKNKKVSEEVKEKISLTLKGRKLSNKTCEKMSESRTGTTHSKKTIKKLKVSAQKRCVPVSQFYLDGRWKKDWIGLKAAAEYYGMQNGRPIQLVCNYYRDKLTKGSKQCKGFIWKYKK
jgi:hypothetical protein